MFRLLIIFFSFLFTIFSLFCVDNFDPTKYENIFYEFKNSISFEIEDTSDKNVVSEFDISTNIFPRNSYRQKIIEQYSNFDYSLKGSWMNYDLKNFEFEEDVNIKTNFVLKTSSQNIEIKEKVNFPYRGLSSEYYKYLEFDDLVNIDNNVQLKTQELVWGKDDAYEVSYSVAKWIEDNIEYNLSSVLENPKRTSTEVFADKKGVCREITLLFASMLRSLDIPVRFVFGYSYTDNSELVDYIGSNFGGHVWVEVLIGNSWVPFDLTYGQYGSVDSSHIEFFRDENMKSLGSNLQAKYKGFEIIEETFQETNDVKILNITYKEEENKNIKINATGDLNIHPKSYGVIELNINSLNSSYVPLDLYFSKPSQMQILRIEEVLNEFDNTNPFHKMSFLLKPNQKNNIKIFYNLSLDEEMVFFIPFEIYEKNSVIYSDKIGAMREFKKKSYSDISSEFSKKVINQNYKVEVNCDKLFREVVSDFECNIKNLDVTPLNNLEVCFQEKCIIESFYIGENKKIGFQNIKSLNEIENILVGKNNIFNQIDIKTEKLPEILLSTQNYLNTYLHINYSIKNNLDDYDMYIILDDNKIKVSRDNSYVKHKIIRDETNLTFEIYDEDKIIYKKEELISTKKTQKDDFLFFLTDIFNIAKKFFKYEIIPLIIK